MKVTSPFPLCPEPSWTKRRNIRSVLSLFSGSSFLLTDGMSGSVSDPVVLRDTVAALRQIVTETASECSPTLLAQREALLDPTVNQSYAECRRCLREKEDQLARCQAQLESASCSQKDEITRLRDRCASLEAENAALRKEQSEGVVYLLRATCEAQRAQIAALKAALAQANACVDKLVALNGIQLPATTADPDTAAAPAASEDQTMS